MDGKLPHYESTLRSVGGSVQKTPCGSDIRYDLGLLFLTRNRSRCTVSSTLARKANGPRWRAWRAWFEERYALEKECAYA